MPNQIQKSLQDCILKMKKPTPTSPKSLSTSTSRILRGCKYPRTPSFSSDQNNVNEDSSDDGAASLSGNFKTIYVTEDDQQKDSAEIERSIHEDENEENPVENFPESGSRRFFVAPASSCCSLMDEARSSISTARTSSSTINDHRHREPARRELRIDDFVAVVTDSQSPYDDFKKSMQEMIEARLQQNGKINWEFMEELLLCYLNLNDKNTHGSILGAFVDLTGALRENLRLSGVPAKPRSAPSKAARKSKIN